MLHPHLKDRCPYTWTTTIADLTPARAGVEACKCYANIGGPLCSQAAGCCSCWTDVASVEMRVDTDTKQLMLHAAVTSAPATDQADGAAQDAPASPSNGFCAGCDTAYRKNQDANKKNSRNASRDCDQCGCRLADCKCMEIADLHELLRQVPAIMARRAVIVRRQGHSSVEAFDSRFQTLVVPRLLAWLSNPKTWAEAAPDGILLSAAYEFLLSLRRSALTSTTPHGRASWGAVAYKSVIRVLEARRDYAEAFCAGLLFVNDHPLLAESYETVKTVMARPALDAARVEGILSRLSNGDFLAKLPDGDPPFEDQALFLLRTAYHQAVKLVLHDAYDLMVKQSPMESLYLYVMMISSVDKAGVRFGERVVDDTSGEKRRQLARWKAAFSNPDPSVFAQEGREWLQMHSNVPKSTYISGKVVEFPRGLLKLGELGSYVNKFVDVMAVVKSADDDVSEPDERGDQFRRLRLVEPSGAAELTMWNAQTEHELFRLIDSRPGVHPVVALKNVLVRDFNGRLLLSAGKSAEISINPATFGAEGLHGWWRYTGQADLCEMCPARRLDFNQVGG